MKIKIAFLCQFASIFFVAFASFHCSPKSQTSENTNIIASPRTEMFASFSDFEPLLHQQDDKLHIINFWATWCKPCVAELPYFEAIHKKYENKNVEVLLVSLDDGKKLETQVIPFLQKKQIRAKSVLLDDADYNAWINKVSPQWSGAIPATYIYKGEKSAFYEQEFTLEQLETIIKNF